MRVTDEAMLIAVRKKLVESEKRLYEANQILAYLFERECSEPETDDTDTICDSFDDPDPVTGLYAGQKPNIEEVEEDEECLE
jgi:hypothetical protein